MLRSYRWSSYRAYAGYAQAPAWLTTGEVWRRVAGRQGAGAQAYRQGVEGEVRQGREERLWDRLVAGTALGSQRFIARLKRVQGGDRAEQMSSRQLGVLTPLEAVVRAVERVRGAPLREFLSRHGDPSRDVLLYVARRRCGLTLRVLGERMGGMRYAAVSEAVRRIERRLAADRAMAAFVQKVERRLLNIWT